MRGNLGEDATEPRHSGTYPHKPVPHEPEIADLAERLRKVGLTPSTLPLGVDIDRWLAAGQTTWDAFPDTCGGKMDAETCALAKALQHENVTLKTGCRVAQLTADKNGTIKEVRFDGPDGL